jgi:hypothetical protein
MRGDPEDSTGNQIKGFLCFSDYSHKEGCQDQKNEENEERKSRHGYATRGG